MNRTAIRLLCIALACVATCARAGAWIEVAPAGTACWDGKPWKFWYRPGSDPRLAVYFEGGGGCWRADLCDPQGAPTFKGAITAQDDPSTAQGLFDDSRHDNPIRGWRILFVPYCTGDVHIGRRTVDYARADGTHFTFAHEGARNTRAALDWVAARTVAEARPPPTVLVGGESAGAIAASFWSDEIGERFPSAQLAVIGDAAGGYRSLGVPALLAQWGVLDALPPSPAYADRERIYFESFYVASAAHHPGARFGQVNFADDATQRRFMSLLGTPTESLTKGLTCDLNEIRRESPNFHSYIYPGDQHVMLRTPALYTTSCEGQRLVDWVRTLIDGGPIENRWCDGSGASLRTSPAPRL